MVSEQAGDENYLRVQLARWASRLPPHEQAALLHDPASNLVHVTMQQVLRAVMQALRGLGASVVVRRAVVDRVLEQPEWLTEGVAALLDALNAPLAPPDWVVGPDIPR